MMTVALEIAYVSGTVLVTNGICQFCNAVIFMAVELVFGSVIIVLPLNSVKNEFPLMLPEGRNPLWQSGVNVAFETLTCVPFTYIIPRGIWTGWHRSPAPVGACRQISRLCGVAAEAAICCGSISCFSVVLPVLTDTSRDSTVVWDGDDCSLAKKLVIVRALNPRNDSAAPIPNQSNALHVPLPETSSAFIYPFDAQISLVLILYKKFLTIGY